MNDSSLDITLDISKEPYIKILTGDNIINLTGQSGSGKSTYALEHFSGESYEILDTDDVLSEDRFKEARGLNKAFGEYLRIKYEELPDLGEDFNLIYKEILDYCKDYDKTIVIDCAQFHCVKDLSILRGKIIILRTCIDTCYERTISRWIRNHEDRNISYTQDELNSYKERKKGLYSWYKGTNEFIRKIDKL